LYSDLKMPPSILSEKERFVQEVVSTPLNSFLGQNGEWLYKDSITTIMLLLICRLVESSVKLCLLCDCVQVCRDFALAERYHKEVCLLFPAQLHARHIESHPPMIMKQNERQCRNFFQC